MASSYLVGKKKITQNDLRRIMNEQKRKISESLKKIDSPLAKYTDSGELRCILCDSVVRSEAVWNVHINSKKHKENIANAKRKKEDAVLFTKVPTPLPVKRPADTTAIAAPPKKLKGILKNAPPPAVPKDFFDTESSKKTEGIKLVEAEDSEESSGEEEVEKSGEEAPAAAAAAAEETVAAVKASAVIQEENLPEGFFDDPLLDAKARNVEYKDPIEEEWEKFQKEMKEETTVSAQIIADDQEEATAERQIEEIEEQMRNWSRVLNLELKKEAVGKVAGTRSAGENEDEASSGEETDFDEYLDWRAKKSYK